MDVDASTSRFRQSTAYQKPQGSGRHNSNYGHAGKRPANSDRASGQGRQRVDNIAAHEDKSQTDYNSAAREAVAEAEDAEEGGYESDSLNFLGGGPCYHSYGGK